MGSFLPFARLMTSPQSLKHYILLKVLYLPHCQALCHGQDYTWSKNYQIYLKFYSAGTNFRRQICSIKNCLNLNLKTCKCFIYHSGLQYTSRKAIEDLYLYNLIIVHLALLTKLSHNIYGLYNIRNNLFKKKLSNPSIEKLSTS